MKTHNKFSLFVLILICAIVSIYRINVVDDKEISWDVLGYYMYLPATFIHDDPMLKDISWLKKVNSEKKLASTLYMVSENDKGEPMYFFLMGLAIFYLPFFFAGHAFAAISGMPMDGFSTPYQYSLVIGAILYTILGLIFLRKILKYFFSDKITAFILVVLVFGTNYIHHLTLKNLETVNVLFMLTTIVVWCTIKWHENYKSKYILAIAISITLMVLIKPSEIFIVIIPLLWNLVSLDDFKQKISRLLKDKKTLLLTLVLCIALVAPQMIYWYLKTGRLVYDSYKNPGVGLDVFSPHIIDVLISYRKGWLLYTPVMIFSLLGFFFMYRKNIKIFYASVLYFVISFFIISSWTEWWYGAAYSTRPLIVTYPILAISFGYFLQVVNKKSLLKILFLSVVAFFILLNQFQWWQLKNNVLDPYRTTKEYYWATFLKTQATEQDKELLMVFRDFSGSNQFVDSNSYKKIPFLTDDFEKSKKSNIVCEDDNHFCRINNEDEFTPIFESNYCELTQKDHIWVKLKMNIRCKERIDNNLPCLVLTMDRKNGSYGYSANEMKFDSISNTWKNIEVLYLTPEIRSKKDRLKCYVWNRGKNCFDIDNISVEVYEKKK